MGSGIVAVPAMRMTAMAEFKRPKSKRDMRSFLGAMGYYRRFIPSFADYSSVLTPATCQSAPTDSMLRAFGALRSVLCNVCVLHVPVEGDVFL